MRNEPIINGNNDIVSLAETKLSASLPFAQFTLEGYHSPYRLGVNNKSGGILAYVKSSIPARCFFYEKLRISISTIPFKANLGKKK